MNDYVFTNNSSYILDNFSYCNISRTNEFHDTTILVLGICRFHINFSIFLDIECKNLNIYLFKIYQLELKLFCTSNFIKIIQLRFTYYKLS